MAGIVTPGEDAFLIRRTLHVGEHLFYSVSKIIILLIMSGIGGPEFT